MWSRVLPKRSWEVLQEMKCKMGPDTHLRGKKNVCAASQKCLNVKLTQSYFYIQGAAQWDARTVQTHCIILILKRLCGQFDQKGDAGQTVRGSEVQQAHLSWMAASQESVKWRLRYHLQRKHIHIRTFVIISFVLLWTRSVKCVLLLLHTHTHIQHGKMLSLSPSSDRCVTLNLKWTPPPPSGCLIMSLHLISTDPHLSLPPSLRHPCSACLAKMWTRRLHGIHIRVQVGLRAPPHSSPEQSLPTGYTCGRPSCQCYLVWMVTFLSIDQFITKPAYIIILDYS